MKSILMISSSKAFCPSGTSKVGYGHILLVKIEQTMPLKMCTFARGRFVKDPQKRQRAQQQKVKNQLDTNGFYSKYRATWRHIGQSQFHVVWRKKNILHGRLCENARKCCVCCQLLCLRGCGQRCSSSLQDFLSGSVIRCAQRVLLALIDVSWR